MTDKKNEYVQSENLTSLNNRSLSLLDGIKMLLENLGSRPLSDNQREEIENIGCNGRPLCQPEIRATLDNLYYEFDDKRKRNQPNQEIRPGVVIKKLRDFRRWVAEQKCPQIPHEQQIYWNHMIKDVIPEFPTVDPAILENKAEEKLNRQFRLSNNEEQLKNDLYVKKTVRNVAKDIRSSNVSPEILEELIVEACKPDNKDKATILEEITMFLEEIADRFKTDNQKRNLRMYWQRVFLETFLNLTQGISKIIAILEGIPPNKVDWRIGEARKIIKGK